MSRNTVLFWQGVTLVLFLAIMSMVGFGLDWFVNAIPPMLLVFIVGAGSGLCVGYLIGERSGRETERRLGSEPQQ